MSVVQRASAQLNNTLFSHFPMFVVQRVSAQLNNTLFSRYWINDKPLGQVYAWRASNARPLSSLG